jgi:hypothetical protein
LIQPTLFHPFPLISILILSSYLCPDLPSVDNSVQIFRPQLSMPYISHLAHVCYMSHPLYPPWVVELHINSVNSYSYEAPRYAILSSFPLLPLLWETKFNTRRNDTWSYYFNLYVFRQETGTQRILNSTVSSILRI